MESEMMDLEQVASYLQRDVREVSKLASRGHLPGKKISGEWRFARAEINYWIETQLHGYTDAQLTALEDQAWDGPLVSALLSEATMAVPMPASTRASVLKELVNLAEQSWQVSDPEAVLTAIRQREDMGSTALEGGVAVPHPRRPLPGALGESVLAYGRTASAIPFGGDHGGLTDIFFLVCCRDHKTHLSVLARLSRMLLRPGFVDDLRAAATPAESYRIIRAAERDLISE
jgi:PTS system nitrogen regulatory IIA component